MNAKLEQRIARLEDAGSEKRPNLKIIVCGVDAATGQVTSRCRLLSGGGVVEVDEEGNDLAGRSSSGSSGNEGYIVTNTGGQNVLAQ